MVVCHRGRCYMRSEEDRHHDDEPSARGSATITIEGDCRELARLLIELYLHLKERDRTNR